MKQGVNVTLKTFRTAGRFLFLYFSCRLFSVDVCRPMSLAWEVRKSSPGKSLSSSAITPSGVVPRSLTFNSSSQASGPPSVHE